MGGSWCAFRSSDIYFTAGHAGSHVPRLASRVELTMDAGIGWVGGTWRMILLHAERGLLLVRVYVNRLGGAEGRGSSGDGDGIARGH